jgi:hypothetical protein
MNELTESIRILDKRKMISAEITFLRSLVSCNRFSARPIVKTILILKRVLREEVN